MRLAVVCQVGGLAHPVSTHDELFPWRTRSLPRLPHIVIGDEGVVPDFDVHRDTRPIGNVASDEELERLLRPLRRLARRLRCALLLAGHLHQHLPVPAARGML